MPPKRGRSSGAEAELDVLSFDGERYTALLSKLVGEEILETAARTQDFVYHKAASATV